MAETGNGMFPLVMCNVGFAAGDRAILRDVNLTLEAGRRTVVLGPNGAGKSVTLRLLHGLLWPTTGEITWGGKTAQPTAQAMVFQRPVLLRRSALANIEYALDLAGVPRAERTDRATAALARVGLLWPTTGEITWGGKTAQ
nr:ATP-binding cassette domain-containing protein [Plasticicumulans sp.]